MTDKPVSPEEILNGILAELGSDDSSRRLAAIQELHSFNYSSEAIRLKLEQLALKDSDDTVARAAAAALDLPTHRHVINQLTKLNRGDRQFFLQEIEKLEAQGLLDPAQADVIKKRYNFDMAPPPAPPQPVPGRAAAPAPQPLPPPAPPQPPGPQPTLLQTLLSETSIKIALYLGAFFVIAAAAILGAAIPELRLPILIIGTFVFGGLAVAIKKRLPQPSFALFIIFSFLLPITANTIEETLRSMFDLSASFSAGYWVFIYLIMAAIWSGSTRLYESRLFSVTAFGSLALAMFRIGDIFEAQPEFYAAVEGVAALSGLAGTWLMKKWKGSNFALPLFLATQLLQVIILVSSISIFGAKLFDPSDPALWHLVSLITWGLASLF